MGSSPMTISDFIKYDGSDYYEDQKVIHYLNEFATRSTLNTSKPIRKVLIITTPRTGSTWFIMELYSRGVCYPDEWYNHRKAKTIVDTYKIQSIEDYESFVMRRASNNNIFIAKIHAYQLQRCRDNGFDPLKGSELIYYLDRRDLAEQAVSYAKSQDADRWDSFPLNSPISIRRIKTAMDDLSQFKKDLESQNIQYNRTFYYEDMVQDGVEKYAKMICDDLGVSFPTHIMENREKKKTGKLEKHLASKARS